MEPPLEIPASELKHPRLQTPPLEQEIQPRCSGRRRQFPQLWREFEATSYSLVTAVPQVTEQAFQDRIEPYTKPALLSAPDMALPSLDRSPLDGFRVCRVFNTPRSPPVSHGQAQPPYGAQHIGPPAHPFTSDSAFELMKAFVLGPSSKTVSGMDEIGRAIGSGRVMPDELSQFNAATELHHLDDFAARSSIAGGPWQTGSVKVKMPCMRVMNTEVETPEFETPGVRYQSLVDIMVLKVKDYSSSRSFVHQPFTEWWCPSSGDRPIRIYGEAYSLS